jgi:hypothetical protein
MLRIWLAGGAAAAIAVSSLTISSRTAHRAAEGASIPAWLTDSLLGACRDVARDRRNDCYGNGLHAIAMERGAGTAMDVLDLLGRRDAAIRSQGHVFAHGIGIAAGHAGENVSETFASCTEAYASGCYHGVIQAYFQAAETVDGPSVNALCEAYADPAANQWLRFQCVHGMGHGLTMFYGHDLPRALAICDLLEESWERDSCYGGAFMESIVNATQPHHGTGHPASGSAAGGHGAHHGHAAAPAFKALDSADAQYPCSIMAERYLEQCYIMQASAMLKRVGYDVGAAAELCEQAPGRYAYTCHQSLGRDISSMSRFRARRAIQLCGEADAEFQPWCHYGVVKDFIMQRADPAEGLTYCDQVPGTRSRMRCYEGVGEMVASLRNARADREAACAAAPDAYRASCLYGARVTAQRPLGQPAPRVGPATATARRTASL